MNPYSEYFPMRKLFKGGFVTQVPVTKFKFCKYIPRYMYFKLKVYSHVHNTYTGREITVRHVLTLFQKLQ